MKPDSFDPMSVRSDFVGFSSPDLPQYNLKSSPNVVAAFPWINLSVSTPLPLYADTSLTST